MSSSTWVNGALIVRSTLLSLYLSLFLCPALTLLIQSLVLLLNLRFTLLAVATASSPKSKKSVKSLLKQNQTKSDKGRA